MSKPLEVTYTLELSVRKMNVLWEALLQLSDTSEKGKAVPSPGLLWGLSDLALAAQKEIEAVLEHLEKEDEKELKKRRVRI